MGAGDQQMIKLKPKDIYCAQGNVRSNSFGFAFLLKVITIIFISERSGQNLVHDQKP